VSHSTSGVLLACRANQDAIAARKPGVRFKGTSGRLTPMVRVRLPVSPDHDPRPAREPGSC
jgi:hypothetical protein